MILEQHYLGCLSQASYLVADESAGVAAVVDPRRDVDVYVERAAELGVRIEHALLTHVHADFLAGHLELAERTGARIHLGARAKTDYPFVPLADGDELTLGAGVRVVALETPGHTPESTCYLVFDRSVSDDQPHAVLTGDTLFIGDVGRPDLMASAGLTAEELAGWLHDSLAKLLELPDATLVYPGHGAGSACGKNLSTDTVSTIGQQRQLNAALQPMSREAFVASVTRGQPPAPAYFGRTAALNQRSRATLPAVLDGALHALTLDDVLERQARGAQVVDVRPADDVAAGHLAGTVGIGLDGKFATWAGSVLDPDAPIILVADPGREAEAATRLGRVGLDNVVGHLDGGPVAWSSRSDLVQHVPRTTVAEATTALASDDPPLVLDVRNPGEVAATRVADSLNLPLGQLTERLAEIPTDRSLIVTCQSGYRSLVAVGLLLRSGWSPDRVRDLAGGMDAWQDETGTFLNSAEGQCSSTTDRRD